MIGYLLAVVLSCIACGWILAGARLLIVILPQPLAGNFLLRCLLLGVLWFILCLTIATDNWEIISGSDLWRKSLALIGHQNLIASKTMMIGILAILLAGAARLLLDCLASLTLSGDQHPADQSKNDQD